jgi:hypothetical protein
MAGKHLLQGLMKWITREQWRDRFEEILEDHLLPTCEATGLEVDDIVSTLGEDHFMRTVWACAFEDMLTREFDDGSNVVDDYLKRRGWKETASVRAYVAALRDSVAAFSIAVKQRLTNSAPVAPAGAAISMRTPVSSPCSR